MKSAKWWMAWLAAAGLASAAAAEEITARQAGTAARNWVDRGYALGKLPAGRTVAGVDDLADPVTGARLHVVRFEGGGFVVTSGDDLVEPVLAFSETGDTVDPDEQNPFWALLRADISAREAAAGIDRKAGGRKPAVRATRTVAEEESPPSASRRRWEELLDDTSIHKRGTSKGNGVVSLTNYNPKADVRVDALVKSRWSQRDIAGMLCYNSCTPHNWVCGCAATALGQIMRYWTTPAYPTPQLTTKCYVGGVETNMTMLGCQTNPYTWSNMPLEPAQKAQERALTESQCREIGKLLYDVGVAVGMSWSEGGSAGNFSDKAADALRQCFGYANATTVNNWYFTLDDVKRTFIPNLDASCPIGLGVIGHATIVDGYGFSDGDFFVHVNFGWGGDSDAWYRPPSMDTTNTINDYDLISTLLCNVHPYKRGNILSGRVLDTNGNPVKNATVSLLSGATPFSTTTDQKGIYAFFTDKTGPLTVKASSSNRIGVKTAVFEPWGPVTNSYGNDVVLQAANNLPNVMVWVDNQGGIGGTNSFRVTYASNLPSSLPVPSKSGFAFRGYFSAKNGVGTQYYDADGRSNLKWDKTVGTHLYAHWHKNGNPEWGYRIVNGKADVMHAPRDREKLVIPEKLGGYPVGGIGNHAFLDATNLVEAIIPASVTHIDYSAFSGCKKLGSVRIPDGVTRISASAFRGCQELASAVIPSSVMEIGSSAFSGCKRLTSVTIPPRLTHIADFTFSGCSGLTSVIVPSGVQRIDHAVFAECDGLVEVSLPNSVTHLGNRAFSGCRSLTSVTLPNSVTNFGTSVFEGCSSLEQIKVSASNPCFAEKSGVLFSKNKKSLVCFPCGRHGAYVIPNSVANIASLAFSGCKGLTSVTIPDSVVECGEHPFKDCCNLEYLEVPGAWWDDGRWQKVVEADVPLECKVVFRGEETKAETTFMANGGQPEKQRKLHAVGAPYGAMPTASWGTRPFLGWFTEPDGGTAVSATNMVPAIPARTLHAHWGVKTTFDGNGGSPAMTNRTYAVGTVYGTLPVASRSGCVFLGWFTEAVGGTAVTAADTVPDILSRTLHAHWGAKTTFKWNSKTQARPYTVGEPYGTLPEVTWAGHAFLGWYTSETGGTAVSASSKVPATGTRTLYAHWTTTQATTFNGNGGTPAVQTATTPIGEKYGTLPKATWAKHAFLGWYTKPIGGTKVSGSSTVTAEATRTLYAHWTTDQVATFRWNDGTDTVERRTNTVGSTYGAMPVPSRAKHAFLGWFTDRTAGSAVWGNCKVTAVATRTLYAHWTTNQVTVFKTNDGTPAAQVATNAIGGKYKAFPKVTWAGHAFLGWFTEMAGGKAVPASSTVTAAATRTLYAHWTADQVVTFAANGGSCAVAKTTNAIGKAYGTLPAPTWAGHAFLGWHTKADGGSKSTATSKVTAAAARTLHAHWTTDQVTTFRWNDGTDTLERRTNAVGSTYGAMPAPRWPKHAFWGWYTAAEGGSAIWGTHKVTAKATRTLYAHWKTTQTVEFKKNDGTSWTLLATNAIGEKYGTLPTVTWAGHTFLGWFTEAKGGQAVSKTDLVTETALRTLFAHWAVAKGTSKARAISAFAVGSVPRVRTTRGTDGLGMSFQIRFEAEAGVEYEIQWTPALGGEWKPLRRWVAEADGEAAVEACPPDGDPVGFFRLIVPDSPGAGAD